ncbi:hypothetical protein DIPPA_50568 [Diplonema papillatum]|nr:hypothetical protein DIPPA_50568 [Diplonema papillatum]
MPQMKRDKDGTGQPPPPSGRGRKGAKGTSTPARRGLKLKLPDLQLNEPVGFGVDQQGSAWESVPREWRPVTSPQAAWSWSPNTQHNGSPNRPLRGGSSLQADGEEAQSPSPAIRASIRLPSPPVPPHRRSLSAGVSTTPAVKDPPTSREQKSSHVTARGRSTSPAARVTSKRAAVDSMDWNLPASITPPHGEQRRHMMELLEVVSVLQGQLDRERVIRKKQDENLASLQVELGRATEECKALVAHLHAVDLSCKASEDECARLKASVSDYEVQLKELHSTLVQKDRVSFLDGREAWLNQKVEEVERREIQVRMRESSATDMERRVALEWKELEQMKELARRNHDMKMLGGARDTLGLGPATPTPLSPRACDGWVGSLRMAPDSGSKTGDAVGRFERQTSHPLPVPLTPLRLDSLLKPELQLDPVTPGNRV